MQALHSLFSGLVSQKRSALQQTPAVKPTELSAAQLQQVAGGLPRVSRPTLVVAAVEAPLPRVS
jgi:hypothetical protein